jgi:hypothetical protein
MGYISLNKMVRLELDGELIFSSSQEQVQAILEQGELDGATISDPRLLKLYSERAQLSEDLLLGFRRGAFSRNKWWPCFLLKRDGGVLRVHVLPRQQQTIQLPLEKTI